MKKSEDIKDNTRANAKFYNYLEKIKVLLVTKINNKSITRRKERESFFQSLEKVYSYILNITDFDDDRFFPFMSDSPPPIRSLEQEFSMRFSQSLSYDNNILIRHLIEPYPRSAKPDLEWIYSPKDPEPNVLHNEFRLFYIDIAKELIEHGQTDFLENIYGNLFMGLNALYPHDIKESDFKAERENLLLENFKGLLWSLHMILDLLIKSLNINESNSHKRFIAWFGHVWYKEAVLNMNMRVEDLQILTPVFITNIELITSLKQTDCFEKFVEYFQVYSSAEDRYNIDKLLRYYQNEGWPSYYDQHQDIEKHLEYVPFDIKSWNEWKSDLMTLIGEDNQLHSRLYKSLEEVGSIIYRANTIYLSLMAVTLKLLEKENYRFLNLLLNPKAIEGRSINTVNLWKGIGNETFHFLELIRLLFDWRRAPIANIFSHETVNTEVVKYRFIILLLDRLDGGNKFSLENKYHVDIDPYKSIIENTSNISFYLGNVIEHIDELENRDNGFNNWLTEELNWTSERIIQNKKKAEKAQEGLNKAKQRTDAETKLSLTKVDEFINDVRNRFDTNDTEGYIEPSIRGLFDIISKSDLKGEVALFSKTIFVNDQVDRLWFSEKEKDRLKMLTQAFHRNLVYKEKLFLSDYLLKRAKDKVWTDESTILEQVHKVLKDSNDPNILIIAFNLTLSYNVFKSDKSFEPIWLKYRNKSGEEYRSSMKNCFAGTYTYNLTPFRVYEVFIPEAYAPCILIIDKRKLPKLVYQEPPSTVKVFGDAFLVTEPSPNSSNVRFGFFDLSDRSYDNVFEQYLRKFNCNNPNNEVSEEYLKTQMLILSCAKVGLITNDEDIDATLLRLPNKK